jgi:hypothetical protein
MSVLHLTSVMKLQQSSDKRLCKTCLCLARNAAVTADCKMFTIRFPLEARLLNGMDGCMPQNETIEQL